PTFDVGRRPPATIQALALVQLLDRPLERPAKLLLGDPLQEIGLDQDDPAGGHGAHRKLLVAREADLAHHEHVERSAESPRHRLRYGHASPRQREDEEVRSSPQVFERIGELFARVATVAIEGHGPRLCPLRRKTTPRIPAVRPSWTAAGRRRPLPQAGPGRGFWVPPFSPAGRGASSPSRIR